MTNVVPKIQFRCGLASIREENAMRKEKGLKNSFEIKQDQKDRNNRAIKPPLMIQQIVLNSLSHTFNNMTSMNNTQNIQSPIETLPEDSISVSVEVQNDIEE